MTRPSKKVFFLFFSGFFGVLLTTVTINLAFYAPSAGTASNNGSEGYMLMKKFGCLSCHKLYGVGSTVGPALDSIGTKRDAEWMARWIKNSSSIKSNSRMPPFVYLPDGQIRIIAEYLSQQRGDSTTRTTRP
ncbi:MAG: cytochrome c [candidate division KSB1 bacterium]|nr:cytochrome c [candidate division KSB1 bacterium]MDZ7304800.1 cytochrome c [candidate division KSB1 bacterium]MDZ7313854.1 cytochrome c [candidate division KSB1 bacterium]